MEIRNTGICNYSNHFTYNDNTKTNIKKINNNEIDNNENNNEQLLGTIYFDFDSYKINESEKIKLDNIIAFLNTRDEKFEPTTLEIRGHTDSRGTKEYNLALGERRATTVGEFLTGSGRIDDMQMQISSYGEDKLADTGTSEEAHSKNRRVVIAMMNTNNF